MARRLRIQYSDAIYHVMARGNGRQDIVQDDADRGRLVACLERAVRRSGWSLYAFVFWSTSDRFGFEGIGSTDLRECNCLVARGARRISGSPEPLGVETDLEVFVEKLLNRSDPEAMDPEAMDPRLCPVLGYDQSRPRGYGPRGADPEARRGIVGHRGQTDLQGIGVRPI